MTQKLVTIAVTTALLVALIVMKHRCGVAMEGLFRVIESGGARDGGTHD